MSERSAVRRKRPVSTLAHTQTPAPRGHSPDRVFAASCIALVATAMTFAVRADIMDALGLRFHLDKQQVGAIAGIAFIGFTVAIFFGGQVVDAVGMGRVLRTG